MIAAESMPLISLEHVSKEYAAGGLTLRRSPRRVHAVSDVSLEVESHETLGLVGESGCGKSTTARLAVALERPTRGRVLFEGQDLATLKGGALRRRRRDLQMVFQDPFSSLDPRMAVGDQIAEPMQVQGIGSPGERRERVRQLLAEVRLPAWAYVRYPHELSGGQRQRVALARGLALRPKLIVADEPVSALDVSVRAQILNLMMDVQEEYGLSYIVVAHDLAIIRHVSRRVAVMYLGQLVETGPTEELIQHPVHPYTAKLIAAVPEPDPEAERAKPRLPGSDETPSAVNPPSGCRFRTRCPYAQEVCTETKPPLRPFGDGHLAACHFPLRAPAAGIVDTEEPSGATSAISEAIV